MIGVSDIPQIISGSFLQKHFLGTIEHLVTDTRNIPNTKNAAFFAIHGAQQDGHEYLKNAYEAGIRCFFVDKNLQVNSLPEATIFQSNESTVATLQKLATYHRRQFSAPIVGITGSNGKTITKEWLSALLSKKFVVVKSPKSYNSQVGVPLSVWNMQPYHTMGVFEAGISTIGEMDALQNVIQPTIGILTNIGSAHAAGFSSLEEKLGEKLKLFSSCDTIVYCADQTLVSKTIHQAYRHKNLVGWSFKDQQAPFFVKKENSFLKIYTPNKGVLGVFPCPFSDAPSLENLSHSLVTALLLGVPSEAISEITKKLTAVKMRLELKEGLNQTYIIDDSYNNDLKGLEVALNFLS